MSGMCGGPLLTTVCFDRAYCTYLVALTVANGDGVKDLWEVSWMQHSKS